MKIEVLNVLEQLFFESLGVGCHFIILIIIEIDEESGIVFFLLLKSLTKYLVLLDHSTQVP
jgi:hypothetical protein